MVFLKNKLLIILTIFIVSLNQFLLAEEEEIEIQAVADQVQVLINDLKTLEKAVYQKSDMLTTNATNLKSDGLNEDILTKHLLKLNEIEDQFRELTNKFEEVNFKLDKLSSRVTKIQSDNQLRFSDLENSNISNDNTKRNVSKKLPGTSQFLVCQKNKKPIQLKVHKLLLLKNQKKKKHCYQTNQLKNNMNLQLVL